MRIGIDARMADWSGVGRYTIGLLKGLSVVDKVNEYILFAAPQSVHLLPKINNFSTVITSKPVLSVGGYREIGRLANKEAADIFHALHYPVPLKFKGKLVTTIHDLIPLQYPGSMPLRSKRFIYRFLNREAIRRSDVVIADSVYTAKRINEFFPIRAKKIKILPLGIERKFFQKPTADTTVGNKLDELIQKPYILSMGNQKAHKNLRSEEHTSELHSH